jgi:hypothetical protein
MTIADLRRRWPRHPWPRNGPPPIWKPRSRCPCAAGCTYGWLRAALPPRPSTCCIGRIPRTIVLGGEDLRNLPSGTVFAGNHRSFADMPLVRVGLSRDAARGLLRRLVTRRWPRAKGGGRRLRGTWRRRSAYPLDRLANASRAAAPGQPRPRRNAVLIFPQGTHARRTDEQGDPPAVRFKTGVAHVAEALAAPVVPFGLGDGRGDRPPSWRIQGPVIGGIPSAQAADAGYSRLGRRKSRRPTRPRSSLPNGSSA